MISIERIESYGVQIPLSNPIKMAGEVVHDANNLIVSIQDSQGLIGWGEAASAPTMTGELIVGMVSASKYLGKKLVGLEFSSVEEFHDVMRKLLYGNQSVKSAFECAFLDLLAQSHKISLHELLGGKKRLHAQVLTMIAGDSLAAEIESAMSASNLGFSAFKIKIGLGKPIDDLNRCTAIRSALGHTPQISADANQGYCSTDALVFAKGAKVAGLDFMEQLVDCEDLESMKACASSTNVPLGADEGIHCIRDIEEHFQHGAASGGSLKVIKLGGMLPVMNAANRMSELGMSINLAGKVAETSIASAANAHLALAIPSIDWGISITNQYLSDDLTDSPLQIKEGNIVAPDGVGLGILPSRQKIDRYRIE